MKKLFYTLILLILIQHNILYAQSPSSGLFSGTVQPGQTCGVADASGDLGKCCFSPGDTNVIIPNSGNPGLDLAIGFVNSFAFGLIQPAYRSIQDYAKTVNAACLSGQPSTPGDLANPSCRCLSPTLSPLDSLAKYCNNIISNTGEKASCNGCINGGGIWTGIGCVYPNIRDFIQKTVFGFGIGLAGGIALLCILYAAFQMQSSQGNPEKLKKAQELFTSCIMGLMLIIFSIFILRLIGVSIFRIPGFI